MAVGNPKNVRDEGLTEESRGVGDLHPAATGIFMKSKSGRTIRT